MIINLHSCNRVQFWSLSHVQSSDEGFYDIHLGDEWMVEETADGHPQGCLLTAAHFLAKKCLTVD